MFSAAYRTTGKPEYEEAAMRARDYLLSHFVDEEQGGVFWSVTPQGEPLDTKKRFYAFAFAIYGLAEHFRATGDPRSLDMAVRLYRDIESHSRDHAEGGYTEASELVGDSALHEEVKEVTRHIAMAALEGRCCDGSLLRRFAGL